MFCSKCGKECAETDRVCGRCGNQLKGTFTAPKIDLSQAEGVTNNLTDAAKRSWARMGNTSVKLAAIAGLLVLSMFLWYGDVMTVKATIWGYTQSMNVTGSELLGESGLLNFLITVMHLVALAAVAGLFFLNNVDKPKMLLPAMCTAGFTFGALLFGAIYGIIEAGDELGASGFGELMEYVKFGPSFQGWVLIVSLVGIMVLCTMASKELSTYTYRSAE